MATWWKPASGPSWPRPRGTNDFWIPTLSVWLFNAPAPSDWAPTWGVTFSWDSPEACNLSLAEKLQACQLPDVFIFKTPSNGFLAPFHEQNALSWSCCSHAASQGEGGDGAGVGFEKRGNWLGTWRVTTLCREYLGEKFALAYDVFNLHRNSHQK